MMKRWMIVPVMTALLLGPTVTAQQAGNDYVSNATFKLPKPAGYTQKEAGGALVIESPLIANDTFKENMRVNFHKVGEQIGAKQFLDLVVANLRKNNYPDIKVIDEQDFYALGYQGKRAVMTFQAGGLNLKSTMYIISTGQDIVQGFAAMTEQSYAQFAPVFDDVMARVSMKSSQAYRPQFAKGLLLDGVFYDQAKSVSLPYPRGMFQLQIKPGHLFKYQNIKPGTRDNKYMSVVYAYVNVPQAVTVKAFAKEARTGLEKDGYIPGNLQEVTLGARKWLRSEMILKQGNEISVIQYYYKYKDEIYYVTVGCLKSKLPEHLPNIEGMISAFRFGVTAPKATMALVQEPSGPVNIVDVPGDSRNADTKKSDGVIKDNRFTSTRHQFSIQVPKNWVYASDSGTWPLKMINAKKYEGDFNKLESIVIVTGKLPKAGMSLEAYGDTVIEQLKPFPNIKIGQKTELTINGEKWGRVSAVFSLQNGQELQLVRFYTIKGERTFWISFGTQPDKLILQEGFFKGILGSFKYTGK